MDQVEVLRMFASCITAGLVLGAVVSLVNSWLP